MVVENYSGEKHEGKWEDNDHKVCQSFTNINLCCVVLHCSCVSLWQERMAAVNCQDLNYKSINLPSLMFCIVSL